jgi:hypothetical protein
VTLNVSTALFHPPRSANDHHPAQHLDRRGPANEPGGSRNPAAPLSMNLNQQALPEALGGEGRQPRPIKCPQSKA